MHHRVCVFDDEATLIMIEFTYQTHKTGPYRDSRGVSRLRVVYDKGFPKRKSTDREARETSEANDETNKLSCHD